MVVASRKKSGSARGRASDGRKRPESTTARTKGAKVSKPPNFQPAEIVLKELSRLPGLQMRDGLDESHVKDLFDALQAGKKLPRCKVFKLKDGRVVLTDGFHRCAAYERAGIEMVPCVVMPGTYFDALCSAAAANKEHLGLKRSNADKWRAAELFILGLQGQGQDWSDHKIAEHVGVSHMFVAKVRRCLPGPLETVSSRPGPLATADPTRPLETVSSGRLGADGRIYAPKMPQTPKCTLPPAVRDLVPGKDFGPPRLGEKLAASGITNAGDFQVGLRRGDPMGLDRGEADLVRSEMLSEGLRRVVTAAEQRYESPTTLDAFLMAICRPLAAKFHRETLEKVVIWRRPKGRRLGEVLSGAASGAVPLPYKSDPMEEIMPTSGAEAAAILAALIGCNEMVLGSKEGPAFFASLGLAPAGVADASPAAVDDSSSDASAPGPAPVAEPAEAPAEWIGDLVGHGETIEQLVKKIQASSISAKFQKTVKEPEPVKPFAVRGSANLYVKTAGMYKGQSFTFEAAPLYDVEVFKKKFSYQPIRLQPHVFEGMTDGDRDKFYFGVRVRHGKRELVIGPPVEERCFTNEKPTPLPTIEDMVSGALIDLGKGAKHVAIQEYILKKHQDHRSVDEIASCIQSLSKLKTPPTLTGKASTGGTSPYAPLPAFADKVAGNARHSVLARLTACLRRKGSEIGSIPKEDIPMETRLGTNLVMVRGFPTTVGGMLSRQGMRTVREFLAKGDEDEDLLVGARKTLIGYGASEAQVKPCIEALETLFRIPSK